MNTDTTIQTHVCKDTLYTIAFKLYKSINSCKKVINIQTVAVIKYTKSDDGKRMKKENIMEDTMWNQTDVHNFYRANQPAIIDRNRMYWCSFEHKENDPSTIEDDEVVFTVWKFDFEHPELGKERVRVRTEPVITGDKLYEEERK